MLKIITDMWTEQKNEERELNEIENEMTAVDKAGPKAD